MFPVPGTLWVVSSTLPFASRRPVTQPPLPMTSNQHDSLVEFVSVSKHYPDGDVLALDGVDLAVGQGQFVSIVGPSGCGKSTLLNLMGGLDRPTSGSVTFAGSRLEDAVDLDSWRRRHVGFVFQSFHLLPNLTAIENVQIPMFGGDRSAGQRISDAEELLAAVDLADRLSHRPSQLSNGQRQRVAIARALANDPALVLADEPTGALDQAGGDAVVDLLTTACRRKNAALVVVTHDERVAALADRVIGLRDGRLSKEG